MIEGVYRLFASVGYTEPLHPALAHVPIGLVVGALIFGLAALVFRRVPLSHCSWNCLVVAEIFVVITVLSGLTDWQHFLAGAWVFPIKIKTILAGGLFCLLLVGLLVGRKKTTPPASFAAVLILSFLAVVGLGYFGGRLVYAGKPQVEASQPLFEIGEKIYVADCQKCHPGGGNVINPHHPVRGSKELKNFDSFLSWIRQPEAPMPAFPPQKISDEQAHRLYDYIINVLAKQPPSR